MSTDSYTKSVIIVVKGVVQGVGFRPFVYTTAKAYHLCGNVSNTGEGLLIHLEGSADAIEQFCTILRDNPPALARIERIEIREYECKNFVGFEILDSLHRNKTTSISPDIAVCEECLEEMNNPHDRRYGYYLINCTQCGPRYSIIETLPYDRSCTSMKIFKMCPECQAEYDDPANRRYHAQPISCHACGPVLSLMDKEANSIAQGDEVIAKATELLKNGFILAIKGIGGFHLMCDASNESAVATLRVRKKRPKKPFAVMFSHIDQLCEYLFPNEQESRLLTTKERPIVLVKKGNRSLASSIAPDIDTIGAMIAYTPLHHILFSHFPSPLVATSANRSDEPIIRNAQELRERLGDVVDFIVDFDRDILNAVDDSIVQVIQNRRTTLRMGRGYAPYSLVHTGFTPLKILAVGGQQKNIIGLAYDDKLILSPHIGDLHTIEAMEYFQRSVETFKRFYDFQPDIIVCDKHPTYATVQWAKDQGKHVIEVQHHYAHALACMAEFGLNEKVLAFCFDGTGYGDDGTIWGGEVFIADPYNYQRIGHIKPFRLLGGEKAIKEPKRIALALLFEVYTLAEVGALNLPLLHHFTSDELALHHQAWEKRINAPLCSSMGRMFDAIASFCDILYENGYEGEGGQRLEERYDPHLEAVFDYTIENGVVDFSTMVQKIVFLAQKKEFIYIATGFINTLEAIIEEFSDNSCDLSIVLSGGVFQNKTLLSLCVTRLEEKGRRVYFQEKTPINDGGIALGQLYHAVHGAKSHHG
ncbi:MAG: carbamoyltransferase HypF [Sulfuricurvum sp.]|nr:carbamoyltransferase HypF [Sulfuricurvum sp.]